MSTIAIIGASPNRAKFGNKAVRAYALRGWQVFPIHPTADSIEGHQSYTRLADVPTANFDRVSLYLPESVSLALLDDLARAEIGELWLNPGADSSAVVDRARRLGLNVVQGCSIVDVGVSPYELPE